MVFLLGEKKNTNYVMLLLILWKWFYMRTLACRDVAIADNK